eukprot:m.279811 g.279811  ORF g.279811 m.279811 type:complete len:541 (-) comp15748_c1_seq3:1176-2798(-)
MATQSKRAKLQGTGSDAAISGSTAQAQKTAKYKRSFQLNPHAEVEGMHPTGVKPLGNMFFSGVDGIAMRTQGLGSFSALPDDVLLEVLHTFPIQTLLSLAQLSRPFNAIACHEPLWKDLALDLAQTLHDSHESYAGFTFQGTWKRTCLWLHKRYNTSTKPGDTTMMFTGMAEPLTPCPLYSDEVFAPWYFASIVLDSNWVSDNTIARRTASQLPVSQFLQEFEQTNTPLIIEGGCSQWPATQHWPTDLKVRCGDAQMKAGDCHMTMAQYEHYSTLERDERPLYVFDKHFIDKVPQLGKDYNVPEYFAMDRDLFCQLAEERPSYRWLIAGPPKSGSNWHIDPNNTHAWNALIFGEKRWIMTPPNHPPPGIFPSPDGAIVATPVSITEWFVNYYEALRASGIPFLEGIQRPGDVVFVPHGWWHVVLNTEYSVAVTQNYVSQSNLVDVLRFMRDKPDQLSGIPEDLQIFQLFCDRLSASHPTILSDALAEINGQDSDTDTTSQTKPKKVGLWSSLTDQGDAESSTEGQSARSKSVSSFSFGFT